MGYQAEAQAPSVQGGCYAVRGWVGVPPYPPTAKPQSGWSTHCGGNMSNSIKLRCWHSESEAVGNRWSQSTGLWWCYPGERVFGTDGCGTGCACIPPGQKASCTWRSSGLAPLRTTKLNLAGWDAGPAEDPDSHIVGTGVGVGVGVRVKGLEPTVIAIPHASMVTGVRKAMRMAKPVPKKCSCWLSG